MLSPKITIDYSKCTIPFDCKRCLQICASAVFMLVTLKSERGKETDKKETGAYRVEPWLRDRCTGCMDCVKACPVNAITIKVPKEVAP